MSRERSGLQEMKVNENEKIKMGRIEVWTGKEQGARRRNMSIDLAFKFLKIEVIMEARSRKGKKNC